MKEEFEKIKNKPLSEKIEKSIEVLKDVMNMKDDIIELEEEIGKPAVQGDIFLRDLKKEVVGK